MVRAFDVPYVTSGFFESYEDIGEKNLLRLKYLGNLILNEWVELIELVELAGDTSLEWMALFFMPILISSL